jgi:superfamily I DNA/RNA helicase
MRALELALGAAVEIRTPLKILFREEDQKILELTDEQAYVRAFVMHRRRALVTGPPGSGKTVLALSISKEEAAKGKRTLLTCFNKRLAEHLRSCSEDVANLTVDHFHGLCAALAHDAGLEVPEVGPDERAFFDEVLPGLLEEASGSLGPRFDAIVVDEAQDFRDWWWPALLSLHRDPDGGELYLFADDSQNLYGGGGFPVATDDVLPPLPHNLRNTWSIAEFVSVFFDSALDGAGKPKGPPGRDVEILDYSDEEGLLRLLGVVLTNLLEHEGLSTEDVVVLTPSGRDKSIVWRAGMVGGYRLSEVPAEGALLWSSVHAFKGLERSVVILAELGERHDDDVDRYVRVGASRATNHLIVLATPKVAADIRRRVHRR